MYAFARTFLPRFLESIGATLALDAVQLLERRPDGELQVVDAWGLQENRSPISWGPAASVPTANPEWPLLRSAGTARAALLPLGDEPDAFMAFLGHGVPWGPADLLPTALSSLHHVLQQHLRWRELHDVIEQSRAIQTSLLPVGKIAFADFDIAAACLPTQQVGGDVYELRQLSPDTLAVAIADATGHGLPAALLARDVVTGLRMGMAGDLKITCIVEKLNRLIQRSALSSRGASMVFGELQADGAFSYVNAGHPRPLLLTDAGFSELRVGGMMLGWKTDAVFKLGFAHLDRGGLLLMFTDGLIEHQDAAGREFGIERVREWMVRWRGADATDGVEQLIGEAREFGSGRPFRDDVTVLAVGRPA